MPPLYNKEFSVYFEPSSFDKFFSSVELVNEIIWTVFQTYRTQLRIYQRKIEYIDVSTNSDTSKKKERENPLFLSHRIWDYFW